MYNFYQQQPSATAPLRNTMAPFPLKGHPVSSLEEAKASSIDFDGTIFYFPDIANKRIYTKQINMDGSAALNMYELTEIPTTPIAGDFVTHTEFDQALARISEVLAKFQEPQNKEPEPPKQFKEVF